MKQFSLRLLAVTLAVAMLAANFVTAVTALDSVAAASEQSGSATSSNTVKVSDAEIIANYYGFFSEGEKAVLRCDAIIGTEHTIPVPSDDDGLISVDAENKTVKVNTEVKKGDYTWTPVAAYLVTQDAIGSDIKTPVELDSNGRGSFSTTAESYSIEVKYEVKVSIDVATQKVIANGPAVLLNGLSNLDAAVACESNLEVVNRDEVYSALLKMTETMVVGTTDITPFPSNSAGYRAIRAIEAEKNSNNGTLLMLSEIAAVKASQNKVEHLLKNSAGLRDSVKDMYEYVCALTDPSEGLGAKMWGLQIAAGLNYITEQDLENVKLLNGILETLKADLEKITEENWAVLESGNNPVKSEATAKELNALDLALTAAKGSASMHDGETFDEAPVAADATVKAGVAQSYVNVNVNAMVVDATNNLSELKGKTARILMKTGASEQEIKDKVEAIGVRQDTLAYWTENAAIYNIDSDHYVYSITVSLDEATSETNVNILYTPIEYTITFGYAETMVVPYGYKLRLENHADAAKSYDYKVNGNAKYQGEIISVCEDLNITRTEGVALKGSTVNAVVADSLIGAQLSAESREVLKSTSFKTSAYENYFGVIRYRVPSVASVEMLSADTYGVTAPSLPSGMLSEAIWNAASVDLLDEAGNILATYEMSNETTEFIYDGSFANARINFELLVEDIDAADAYNVANIPFILAADASEQLSILNRMADGSLYSALSSLTAENISLIVTVVNASEMSQAAKDAVSLLKTDCVDAAGNILLYSYLTAYKTAKARGEAEGLKYYYTANNSANIKNQLNILSDVFNALCPEDVNNPDRQKFTKLLSGNGLSDYVEKLDSIREAIDSCKNIAPVSDFIDTESASLGSLASAVYNAIGKATEYEEYESVVLTGEVICAAPGKSAVNVIINVARGDGTTDSYRDTVTLPEGTFVGNVIKDKLAALDASLSINKNYYSSNKAEVTVPAGNITIDDVKADVVITYTPYSYTVSVPGTADQSFFYDMDWTIVLPAAPDANTKLIYTVAGETVEVVGEAFRYTFNGLTAFDSNRHLDVTVESVDLESEKFLNFINILNEAVGEVGGRFIPVTDGEGNTIIVFRVSSDISGAIETGVVANLPIALAMYDNVTLGGKPFWDGTQVHLQAMTDMVASSGFSLAKFCDIITEDGRVINDAALGALEPLISTNGNIGGRLMASSINLDGKEMGFYVTLSDTTSASMLAKMRNGVAKVKDYVNIVCEDEQFKFVITAPDAIYPYYLAQMLVSGNVDITDISALNLRDSIRYEWGLIQNILHDDNLSVETFENTFAMLGKDVDLSSVEGVFNNFKKANYYLENNVDVVVNDSASDAYSATFMIDLSGVFRKVADRFGIDDTLMNLIYESAPDSDRFEIDFSVKLANIIDKDYDAIVFDVNGNGLTKKFFCTNNLADTLNNLGNYGIVILTSDTTLEKDVYIPNSAVIDLNGFTLTGNISSGGTVRIVDSRLGVEEAGVLDGKLGSGNFVITGGKYTCDISALLTNGYYVNENGYVRNKIYSLKKNGNDIEIALSADYINNVGLVDFQAVLVDIAVDVAMSAYSGAAIAIDGNYIYSFSCEDITNVLASGKTFVINSIIDVLDTKGFSTVLNSVVAKLTDFKALKNAINTDSALVDYELSFENWNIVPYIAEGNYITFDSVPANKETGRFTVVIEGSEQEKAELAKLCGHLSAVKVENFEINVNDISYGDGFSVDFNGNINVHIDLSGNRAYAALIVATAAYSSDNWMTRAIYKAAIEEYLNGEGSDKIVQIIEQLSVADLIATCKAIGGVSCETILTDIGLDTSDNTLGMISLLNSYGQLVSICDKALTRLDITGNSSNLAGNKVEGTYATYRLQTELVNRVSVTLSITTAPLSDQMIFDKPTIDTTDAVVAETVKGFKNDVALSDGTVGMIVDATGTGISVETFLNALKYSVDGAIETGAIVYDKDGNVKTSGLVCTGDKLVISAFNGVDTTYDEHVIVITGDVNGTGFTDVGDAVKLSNLFNDPDTSELSAAQKMAADLNANGIFDVGDAVKLSNKFNDTGYNSSFASGN